ncbi:MAG: SUMF1/EgtB/PvdO family nonheme iron enzyme [Pirellulales bacterium]
MKGSIFYVHVILCPIMALACAVGLYRPAYAVDIDWVTVGNPGNADDTFNETYGRAWGGVNHVYRIAKYEVTNAQYAAFLNAKGTIGDPLQLFDTQMSSSTLGGIGRSGGGTAGDPFVYTVKSDRGNNPVVFVNWYDSLRFANWLNNGQGAGDTESGSYTLLGGTPVPSNAFPFTPPIARNPGARVVLPSEDEWYKAAYHKNDGPTGNYWDYPTATDDPPFSDEPPGSDAPQPSNTANQPFSDGIANNYDDGYAVTGSSSFSTTQNYLTDIGAYSQSISPYGTFDQAGNALEWTESLFGDIGYFRVLRGGDWGCCFGTPGGAASAWTPGGNGPEFHDHRFGFRVAMVPEPGSLALFALSIALLAARRRRVSMRQLIASLQRTADTYRQRH